MKSVSSLILLCVLQLSLLTSASLFPSNQQPDSPNSLQTSDFYFVNYPINYTVTDSLYRVVFHNNTKCEVDETVRLTSFPVVFNEDFKAAKCSYSVSLLTQLAEKLNPSGVLFISQYEGQRWQINTGLRELPNVLLTLKPYFASVPFSSSSQINTWIESNTTVTLTHAPNIYQTYRSSIQGYLGFSAGAFLIMALVILGRSIQLARKGMLETWFRRYLVFIAFLASIFYFIYQLTFAIYAKGYFPESIKESMFGFAGALVYTNYSSIMIVWLRIRSLGFDSHKGWKALIVMTWITLLLFWASAWLMAIGYMVPNKSVVNIGMYILLYGFAPIVFIQCIISFFAISKVRSLLLTLDYDSYRTAALKKLTIGVTGTTIALLMWLVCVGVILAIQGYAITSTVIKIVAQDGAFFLLIFSNAASILLFVENRVKDSSLKEPSGSVSVITN